MIKSNQTGLTLATRVIRIELGYVTRSPITHTLYTIRHGAISHDKFEKLARKNAESIMGWYVHRTLPSDPSITNPRFILRLDNVPNLLVTNGTDNWKITEIFGGSLLISFSVDPNDRVRDLVRKSILEFIGSDSGEVPGFNQWI